MPCVVVNADAPRDHFSDSSHVLCFIEDYEGLATDK
jgi:hypothetical protein